MAQRVLILTLGLFFSEAALCRWGTWVKEVGPLPSPAGFSLLKVGAFGKGGGFKANLDAKAAGLLCPEGAGKEVWLGHRLSAGEKLTAQAGTRLGQELARFLAGDCPRSVEIDLEPLPSVPDWLSRFTAALRKALPESVSLRLAVPPVTGERIVGYSWKAEEAALLLKEVNGFDFMIYDTGLSDSGAYGRVLADVLDFVASSPAEKTFVLGLPAYPDRTKLHKRPPETLQTVEAWARSLTPERKRALCRPGVRWAFYAGWTITEPERAAAARIEKEAACG